MYLARVLSLLHVKHISEMCLVLRDAAELIHKLGDIPKPDLVNLFIGLVVQHLAAQAGTAR